MFASESAPNQLDESIRERSTPTETVVAKVYEVHYEQFGDQELLIRRA